MQITGQCHCGAIRFTALIDPEKVFVCHCSDCQVLSGAPFRAVAAVPVEQVQMQGQARHYVKVAASGNRRAQHFTQAGVDLSKPGAGRRPRKF